MIINIMITFVMIIKVTIINITITFVTIIKVTSLPRVMK